MAEPRGPPPEAAAGPGAPRAEFEALRAALEAALRREPAEAAPAELRPLLALPWAPPAKCRCLDGARLLRDNLGAGRGLGGLRAALSILEKYGRNLLQPRPPRHWRCVRYRNPVFRGALGDIQCSQLTQFAGVGGAGVLRLLGYTEESEEGLSFPEGVPAPHPPRVAAVTADLLLLRTELELLLANQHPNPQFFAHILEGAEGLLVSDSLPITDGGGATGGTAPCPGPAPPGDPSPAEAPPPGREAPPPGAEAPPPGWRCAACTLLNPAPSVLCGACERPRLARRPIADQPAGWACPHCTYWNEGAGLDAGGCVCEVCHRPANEAPTLAVAPPPAAGSPAPQRAEALPPSAGSPAPWREAERQRRLRDDGRRVVALLRAAEAQGVPAEAVLGPALAAGGGAWAAVGRARAGLGAALAALAAGEGPGGDAAPGGGDGDAAPGGGPLGPLSLREAARAWARARGHPQRARSALLGQRRRQLRALAALGFGGAPAAAALFQNGGALGAALGDLQRGRLQPFLRRLWQPAPPLDFDCPDQQALARRVLATLPVASWGRALLVAALGRELGLGRVAPEAAAGQEAAAAAAAGPEAAAAAELQELLEAVAGGPCPERALLLRRLRCECAVCGWALPRRQALSLTCCQCPLCPECFRGHFRVGVRERGVRDLVCPACARPDLQRDDPEQALRYFSTLDVQLRQCLDADTYQLFTRKLTELELTRDPKFLWCTQCSFGFIFEAEQGPAQCPQCRQRFCPRCQRPWEPPHAALSCEEFGAWLRARDPQPGPGGLAAFLQEHGIACPQCGLWFALARGGCMHLQCSQCRHQFCSGCLQPFHPKDSCPRPGCPLRGSLHGHHPRDCLFYLRDWDPPRLQQLLRDNGVPFDTEPPEGAAPVPGGGCGVLEQRETPEGLRDQPCGRPAPPGQAGLCRSHYTEYLVRAANARGLDPAPLYGAAELLRAAERHLPAGRPPPAPGESPPAYRRRLRALLRERAPVRPRPPPAPPAP